MEENKKSVLIGVVNRKKDLEIALKEHWYRMPLRYAPKKEADFLALYQTHRFGKMGKSINYYTPIQDSSLVLRKELFPEEKDHPRQEEIYKRLNLGPLLETPQRIKNKSRRRISFGFTTITKLFKSNEVSQLFDIPPIEEIMLKGMRRYGFNPLREYYLMENRHLRYRLDFAFFCQKGKIDVECDNQKWHDRPAQKARDKERNHYLKDHGWTVLRFSDKDIRDDLESCFSSLKETIENLGGLMS